MNPRDPAIDRDSPELSEQRPLREVLYSLKQMMQDLPTDRDQLQIGHELIGQEEISEVFRLKRRRTDGKEG